MKTFNQLSIGDVIYRLCDNYDLGKPDKAQVTKIKIESLSVDAASGNLLINKVDGRYSDNYWSIVVKVEKLNKSHYRFDPNQNTFRKGFYFINEAEANYIVRRAVIGKINNIEKSIPKHIAQCKNEIETLRATFYEVLNPSFYPEFTIN